MIRGYKSFAYNYTNQAGEIMQLGKLYHCPGKISYNHNGYHMASRFEDTIAFSDKVDEDGKEKLVHDVVIAEVIGSGEIDEVSDSYADYYGYYDMYACSDMLIVRYIPREEVIKMALKLPPNRLERFVSNYELREGELELFKGIEASIDLAIEFYQEGNADAYSIVNRNKVYSSYCKTLRRVIK